MRYRLDTSTIIDQETGEILSLVKVRNRLNKLDKEFKDLNRRVVDCEFAQRTEMAHHRVIEKELKEKIEQLRKENQTFQDQYERKDRQLKRTKKDIEKYTDYFMNELNWDCDRIIKEVFK